MSAATTPTKHQGSWATYNNIRFAYGGCYPKYLLKPQGESPNGDGQRFASSDGAVALMYGSYNLEGKSLLDVLTTNRALLFGSNVKVIYKVIRKSYVVLSGFSEKLIIYEKVLSHDDRLLTLRLTYNQQLRREYDPIAADMSACFHAERPTD